MEPNSGIRKDINTFLNSIPDDLASHNALFNTIEELSKTTNYASNYSLWSSLSSGIKTLNSLYDARPFKSSIPSAISLYRKVQNRDFLSGLVDNGLFEEISKSEESKNKVSGLIDSFINSTNKEDIQNEIIRIDQLIAQEKATQTDLNIKENLLNSMGSLSQIMIYYRDIAKDLNDKGFLDAALSQPELLKDAYKNLMNFVQLPAKKSADKVSEAKIAMVNGFVDLATQKNVRKTLIHLANQKLVDDIFNLPQITPAVKEYQTLVKNLARPEQSEKFQELFGALVGQAPEFKKYISDLMDFLESPDEPSISDPAYDKSMVSLVDAIKPDVILAAIPLIDETLIDNILNLSKVQNMLHKKETLNQMLLFTAKTQKEFERILDDPSKSQALSDDEKNALNAALTELKKQAEEKEIAQNTPNLDSKAINQKKAKAADSAPTSPKHGGAVNKKIIETIQGLATNSATCKELEASFQANKVKLTQALDKLIEHPVAGKTLKDFCLNGAEVADFLPKICNEKGLKAVASYAENRSTLNLINIFYQTNTLGFAISHFAKSILKPKEQEKPITLEEKAEKLKSFSEKIRQKKKTYVEQVQDRKSAPQIGLTQ